MGSIIFLGCAGDEETVAKQSSFSGGIVIQSGGYQFILDPGPGCLLRAKQCGINLRETTAVMVSHAHINHCNDVNAVLGAMSHNAFDVNGVLISNSTFVNGNEEMKISPMLTHFHQKCVERIIIAKPDQRIGIESVEIQTVPAFHSDPNAIGFKFITPDFTAIYSGDTKYHKDLVKSYKKADILILNTVYPEGYKEKNADNLSVDDAAKIIEKTSPQLVILTHFGKKMIEGDPIDQARNLQKKTGVQVLAASDGMKLNPKTYSASAKQKTLGGFKKGEKVEVIEEEAEDEPVEEKEEQDSVEEVNEESLIEETEKKKESQAKLFSENSIEDE